MTVAVGFMCTDGIVLAADREISTRTVKIDGPKAWVFSYPRAASDPALRIGIVGAGDYGYIKFAAERLDAQLTAWIASHGSASLDDVSDALQTVTTDIHHEHLYPYGQPHERPVIELMVGAWVSDGSGIRLLRTSLTAVTKVWNYEAVGIGSDLSNFLVRRFYTERNAPHVIRKTGFDRKSNTKDLLSVSSPTERRRPFWRSACACERKAQRPFDLAPLT